MEAQPTIRHSVIPVEDFHRDGSFGVVGYDECWIAECPIHGVIGDADTEQLARAFDCPLCVQEIYGLAPLERDPADQRVREDERADENYFRRLES